MGIILLLVFMFYLAAICFALGLLVAFFIAAFALGPLAKAHHFSGRWMAWVPGAQAFLIGRLAKDCATRRGKPQAFAPQLLISFGIITGLSCTEVLLSILFEVLENGTDWQYEALSLAGMCAFGLCCLAAAWHLVVLFLAAWQIFCFWEEDKAPVYLIFSILFPITLPFFLLVLGNRAKKGELPRSKEAKAAAEAYMQAVQAEQPKQPLMPEAEPTEEA